MSSLPQEHPAGSAYFAVPGGGTFVLDDAGPRLLRPTKNHVMSGRLGPGDELWISELSASYRVVGKDVFPLPDTEITFKGIGGKVGGELWGADSFQVAHLEAGKWKLAAQPDLGSLGDSFRDLAVEADGTAWALSFKRLYRRPSAGEWKLVRELDAEDQAAGRLYTALGLSQGQLRFVLTSDQLWIRRGEDFAVLTSPLKPSSVALSVSPAGKAVVRHRDGISIIDPSGSTREVDLKALGLTSYQVRGGAADARERVWLATEYGLVVLDERDRVAVAYAPGTMAGVDDAVTDVWPVGAGPSRFLPPDKPRTATLRARVYVRGIAVPNAKIELCTSPDMIGSADTPCDGQPLVRTAVSGSGGEFELTDVPVGNFSVAFQEPSSKRWRFQGADCCTKAVDGVFTVKSIHPPE